MDNLTVHHSKLVQSFIKEHHIECIFNVPYSPEYNPIELVFNLLKQSFKKLRLEAISKNKKRGFKNLVKDAIASLDNN